MRNGVHRTLLSSPEEEEEEKKPRNQENDWAHLMKFADSIFSKKKGGEMCIERYMEKNMKKRYEWYISVLVCEGIDMKKYDAIQLRYKEATADIEMLNSIICYIDSE